jgi:hypothetical protein
MADALVVADVVEALDAELLDELAAGACAAALCCVAAGTRWSNTTTMRPGR